MSTGNSADFPLSSHRGNGGMNEQNPVFKSTISFPTVPFLSSQGYRNSPLLPESISISGNPLGNSLSTSTIGGTTYNIYPMVLPFNGAPCMMNYGQNVFLSTAMPTQSPLSTSFVLNSSCVTPDTARQTPLVEILRESHETTCQSTSLGMKQQNKVSDDSHEGNEQERESLVDEKHEAKQKKECDCHPATGTCERIQEEIVIDDDDDQEKNKPDVIDPNTAEDKEKQAESTDHPVPRFGRWEVVFEHSRKDTSKNSKKTVTRTTPERRHQVLKNNPAIARTATADIILELECKEMKDFIIPLLNGSMRKLEMKMLPGKQPSEEEEKELGRMYSLYQSDYVPSMDKKREHLIGKIFKKENTAICVLSLLVRSYVAGFTVHKKRNYRVAGCNKLVLQCHTLTKSKREPEEDGHERVKACPWYAIIMVDENGARFTEIESFKVHSLDCLRHFARLTSIEVSFQNYFATAVRPSVMDQFHQTVVRPGTLYQRKFRMKKASIADIDAKFNQLLKKQKIIDGVSNVRSFQEAKLDEETKQVLLFLSYLKKKGYADTFAQFEQQHGVVELIAINIMWKDGKRLLSTHSDAIFVDSMWNVNVNGYFALTIVVQDENTNIRLTSICIAKDESKYSWSTFFSWVKLRVPSFNPQCIITDGASYIGNTFKDVVAPDVHHVVCWWHQRETLKGNYSEQKRLRRICLSIIRASTQEEIQHLKERGKQIPFSKPKDRLNRDKLLDNAEKNALINLKVFTGGTVTNSYSESINKLLREAGLTVRFPMLHVLRSIHNFAVQYKRRTPWPISPTDRIRQVVTRKVLDTVTNGTLLAEKKTSSCYSS